MPQYKVSVPEVPEYKKVIFKDEINKKVKEGIDILAAAVASTLGPNGKNVIIKKNFNKVYTKDGVTVARSIDFQDYEMALGASMVKEAAIATNDIAGDGTTCSTILVHKIITEGLKKINSSLFRKGTKVESLVKEIEEHKNIVIDRLRKASKVIDNPEEVVNIATISANDKTLGKIIGDIYNKIGKEGNIIVEESKTNDTSYELVEGTRFDSGYVSPFFITNWRREKSELDNPAILITNLDLTSFMPFVKLLKQLIAADTKNIVVIGNKISGEALLGLLDNHQKGHFGALAIEAPYHGKERDYFLEDLALMTGGKYISKELNIRLDDIDLSYVGRAKKIVTDRHHSIIIEGSGEQAKIDEKIESLQADYSKSNEKWLKERIARLRNEIAILNIGGQTKSEIEEKKYRVEDATHSTKVALEDGIVPGGEVALINAARVLPKDSVVYKACLAPFNTLLKNIGKDPNKFISLINNNYGYDAREEEMCDLMERGIIDPVKVPITALENAVSVAVNFLRSQAVVFNIRDVNKAIEDPLDV